jgi:hypothetical protein
MQELTSGAEVEDANRSQLGAKISRLVRLDMRDLRDKHGWDIRFVADQSSLVISTPLRTDSTYRQYVMHTAQFAWGLWRDLPYVCGAPYGGDILIGAPDGRLLRMDRGVDNIKIGEPVNSGDDIGWYLLSTFTSLGAPALNKRVKFIRPNFSVTESKASVDCYAMYDYYTLEPDAPVQAPPTTNPNVWDTALWDAARWSGTDPLPYNEVDGAWGMGSDVAVAMVGRTRGECLFVGWDIMWDVGGFL